MANLNPLKYCFQCRRSKPRASFRSVPGLGSIRRLCAECYAAIAPAPAPATPADSDAVERAVYDGMRDLRK
jgi:hypothetical protein